MKLIQLFAAMIAITLLATPLARAQETETPTDTASPTPAEKAETTKSDDEKKAETATTEAEKSATPVAKSAQKKERPRALARNGGMEAQLKDIETRWEAAYQSHDAKVVDEILADNYVLTDEKGKVFNRRGALKEFKKNRETLEKATASDLVVHPINNGAAVVTGMSHEVGKDRSGKAFDRTYRWTDTFVNHNGKWQCVASQVALVSQK